MNFKNCLFAAAIFLSACNKTEMETGTPETELSDLTKEVISQPTIMQIRQGYALLSSKEKESLWKLKYKTILKNDSKSMTEDQLKIVKSLRDFLQKNSIAKLKAAPTLSENFIKSSMPYFQKHFTSEQLFLLIESAYFSDDFSIFNAASYLTKLTASKKSTSTGKRIDGGGGNCTCYYSISCTGSTCNDGTCTRGPAECGLFGTSNCTGTCG